MNTLNDGIVILLANRSFLYKLLQRIFGDVPDINMLETITNSHTKDSLQLLVQDDDQRLDNGLFEKLKQEIFDNPESTMDKLKSEYTYLFIGPNKLPAPPWESVYLNKERTIFQESTLKVRGVYLEYHFLPARYPHEADDHIALELDFMAHLADQTFIKFEENKTEEVKKLLIDQRTFLEEHLLIWVGEFAEQIQHSKTHYFYPQIAKLTEIILQIDVQLINQISTSI